MSQSLSKKISRAGAYWALRFFAALFKITPFILVKAIGLCLLPVAYATVGRHRRVARETLNTAFEGTKSPAEMKRIIRKCFFYMGFGMVEMTYYINHGEETRKRIRIEGRENLDAALAKGKGVIGVCAHFGNFPLMMVRLGQEKDYVLNTILRPLRNPWIGDFLYVKKKEQGINPIYSLPKIKCVAESLEVLGKNQLLLLPIDQNFESDKSVYVDFFERKASTATSPVVFAQRTGAVILPVTMVHESLDHHRIIFDKPIDLIKGKNDQETIYLTMSKITSTIEGYIRQYPHEWAWMHRRWKTQPREI